jgi:hypothetical protein
MCSTVNHQSDRFSFFYEFASWVLILRTALALIYPALDIGPR